MSPIAFPAHQPKVVLCRIFHVDVPPGRSLGVRINTRVNAPVGQVVLQLPPSGSGFVLEWNRLCQATFLDDVLNLGDIIVRANLSQNPQKIHDVLKQTNEACLLVVARLA